LIQKRLHDDERNYCTRSVKERDFLKAFTPRKRKEVCGPTGQESSLVGLVEVYEVYYEV